MVEPNLQCNYPKCKASITSKASITRCSHIFCKNHPVTGEGFNRQCPACSAFLDSNFDVIVTKINTIEDDISPLFGYSIEEIFEIMSRSLQFWTFQMDQRLVKVKNANEYYRACLAKEASTMETMNLKFKQHLQVEDRKMEFLRKEYQSLKDTTKELQEQLNEKSRQLLNLQSRYEGLRRQSMASVISREAELMDTEPVNFKEVTSFMNREVAPLTPRFVFTPNNAQHSHQNQTPRSHNSRSTPRPSPFLSGNPGKIMSPPFFG